MPVDEFGGDWTAEKLERVRKYLAAYTIIFARNPKAQKLISIYVDAFAGTGYRTKPPRLDAQTALFQELAEPESEAFLKGSARIALEVAPPFKQYVFIEQEAARAQELEKLKLQFPDKATCVTIVREDANTHLKEWCKRTELARLPLSDVSRSVWNASGLVSDRGDSQYAGRGLVDSVSAWHCRKSSINKS